MALHSLGQVLLVIFQGRVLQMGEAGLKWECLAPGQCRLEFDGLEFDRA